MNTVNTFRGTRVAIALAVLAMLGACLESPTEVQTKSGTRAGDATSAGPVCRGAVILAPIPYVIVRRDSLTGHTWWAPDPLAKPDTIGCLTSVGTKG